MARQGVRAEAPVSLAGPGDALPTTAAEALANMRTNRQGRAVLGIVATFLRRGYEVADTVTGVATGGAQKQAKALLDHTNRRAQQIYTSLPDNDEPLTDLNRRKIAQVVQQAMENTKLVSTAAEDLNRGLIGALVDLLVDNVIPPWLKNALPKDRKTIDLAIKIGIGVAAVVGVIVAVKLVKNIALGGSDPAEMDEAESAALALARRKR